MEPLVQDLLAANYKVQSSKEVSKDESLLRRDCLGRMGLGNQVFMSIVPAARRAMSAPGIACSFARFLAPERER